MPGRHPRRLRLVALLAACCLLLAACGEDSAESTSAETTGADAAEGLSVIVEPAVAAPGSSVQASVRNDTEEQFTYGAAYEMEQLVDGEFEPVDLPSIPVIEIAYVAPPGEVGGAVEVQLPEDLEPGAYRVLLGGDLPGVGELSGGLEVSDGV